MKKFFTLVVGLLTTMLMPTMAEENSPISLSETSATALEDGFYVIKSLSSSGTGFLYTELGLSERPYRLNTGIDLTTQVSDQQKKYIWQLTNKEDGSFTLKNLDTGTYVPADNARNKNMTGTETANLKIKESDGYFYLYMTNYTHSGETLYVHTNKPSYINWSYWNDCSPTGTSIQPSFYKLSEDPTTYWTSAEEEDDTDDSNFELPEIIGDEWPNGLNWYTLQNGSAGFFLSDNGTATYIALNDVKTDLSDADLWLRSGNATNGYRLYNKAAGPSKVLAAPTTMTGTTGSTSYPIMVDKNNIPEGYTDLWIFTTSSYLGDDVKAYFIAEKDYPAARMNNRDNKLAFWTGGADAGSSFQWIWAKTVQPITMDNGSFTATNAGGTWASVWTSNTTPQFTLNANRNNMKVETSTGGTIEAWRGNTEPQPYTISAGSDYIISDYSFDFISAGTTSISVIDAAGNAYASSTETQTISVTDLKESTATFTLSGSNNGIVITNFLVTIQRNISTPEPQFDVFPTLTTSAIPYRIPGIATAYDGTLVCVADYRYSRADIGSGRIDLHIRRSHDNGETWDDIMMPSNMQGNGNCSDGNKVAGFGDPCIVGDSESPRMMITSCSGYPGFFSGNRTQHLSWARWYSDDNGATWTGPDYIDEKYIYSKFDNSAYGGVTGWFVGAGRIFQSKTTKIGDYYRLYCSGSSYNKSQTANWVLYSDDFGLTWEFLGGCDVSPIPGGDEPKCEELPDGSVLISSRVGGGRRFNIFNFTNTEKAEGSWGAVAVSNSSNGGVVFPNACNGEPMMVPATRRSDGKKLYLMLQSGPFGPGRSNVGIYYKELESLADFVTPEAFAKQWDGRHQCTSLGSAYSSLDLQHNNTVAFVYEEETYCGAGGGGYTIAYKNYTIEQITDSAYAYLDESEIDRDAFTSEGISAKYSNLTAGTYVGCYSAAGVEEANSALDEYKANPSKAAYEGLNSKLQDAERVEISEGTIYRLRNFGRQNATLYLTASGETDLTVAALDEESEDQIWTFQSTGEASYWNILNPSRELYIGATPNRETRTTLTSESAPYIVESTINGESRFQCTTPSEASYPFLHLAGDCVRIVPWLANSPAANAASYWYIEPTDIETAIALTPAQEPMQQISAYDLQGRKVNTFRRPGVYIFNRKKVIVK